MTIQTVNLGTAPTGAGGDTFRSTGAKMNENFTNNTHAASRYVGTAAGNVMEVGAFGIGGIVKVLDGVNASSLDVQSGLFGVVNSQGFPESGWNYLISMRLLATNLYTLYLTSNIYGDIQVATRVDGQLGSWTKYLSTRNTTTDANGFIKAASPIVKLFANKIELNDEAAEQNITFEKLDVGHYLLKGTSGFATEGWYIETPKDANGNILFTVIYHQLENKDIEIKTFKKKFDVESASIIPNLDNPVDISTGRWIDIRLQEIPKSVPEISVVTKNDAE
ncbi:hypothetical protein QZJ98_09600 [Acinetobacter baumannii]|uniref:phage tail fiber protein n=1 Tax=Acinetobacter baumannii TaxID=470 RepID=UPI0001AF0E61|nr:hypothetical protein [Acinetobacter baumannii]EHU1920588.1 hypothetical protein [Acinetobacter baumannii]EHU1964911.1 hypothetical protein [Acinetobacter baumannii]EKP45415.1 hypothetical protein ACIN5111_1212 [Acinetobacter baumannii OIFC111]EKU3892549.1 hypothetical protein [Acinetobacter baumannii]MBD0483249.1 hypothetical protein [Acinetobacter baumannii]